MTLDQNTSPPGLFVSIANIECVKMIDFSFKPKIIRLLIKDHVP